MILTEALRRTLFPTWDIQKKIPKSSRSEAVLTEKLTPAEREGPSPRGLDPCSFTGKWQHLAL